MSSKTAQVFIEGLNPSNSPLTHQSKQDSKFNLSSEKKAKRLFPPLWAVRVDSILSAIIRPFTNWRFLRLFISLLLLLGLMYLDSHSQTYQDYPISPTGKAVEAPKYSPEDQYVIDNYSNEIISNHAIKKGSENVVVCDLFLKGSKIIHVSKFGSYWKVQTVWRGYKDLYFFKAKNYSLKWLRVGMISDNSESKKRYAVQIEENKKAIAEHNAKVRKAKEEENKSFLSKIINPYND